MFTDFDVALAVQTAKVDLCWVGGGCERTVWLIIIMALDVIESKLNQIRVSEWI